MLFNSYLFVFGFLPITVAVWFLIAGKWNHGAAIGWLVCASLFFYGWWNPIYLPLLLTSISVNWFLGRAICKSQEFRRLWLVAGLIFNLGLLGYFKYTDFLIESVNLIAGSIIPLQHVVLPLAISFFTFQQIAYLVDCYSGKVEEKKWLDYVVFVCFFPQLIAGPIVHHREMMPQFAKRKNSRLHFDNLAAGLFVFSIGLFKKVVVADYFAIFANQGFDTSTHLNLLEGWCTSLSYTLQLYFDFSGYTDMAVGAALLFNISLPTNFNSPYKAVNIQDFWRRWHMTLSRFLRDYLYFPLGGNRGSNWQTYRNLFITFLLGGLWHGASWMFIIWGSMHGLAAVINKFWQATGHKLHPFAGWFLTFNFVNITWVFFRARSLEDAGKVLRGMFGGELVLPEFFSSIVPLPESNFGLALRNIGGNLPLLACILAGLAAVTLAANSTERLAAFRPGLRNLILATLCFAIAVLGMNRVSEFLYFNF